MHGQMPRGRGGWSPAAEGGDDSRRLIDSDEHVAILERLPRGAALARKDDLLADEVAAIFGLDSGRAELLALCFRARSFDAGRAEAWLRERGFRPVLFVQAPEEGEN